MRRPWLPRKYVYFPSESAICGLGVALEPLLEPMLAVLGRSWVALGAYVGGLGPLLGPKLAVLGRSWDLCWRSWAAMSVYVGGLGLLSEPVSAVLAAIRAYVGGPWRPWAEKCTKPERERDLQ